MSLIGSTKAAAVRETMLVHEAIEYIGTLKMETCQQIRLQDSLIM